MTIKPVVCMGDKHLGQPSEPVTEFGTQSLKDLLQDMHDTMIEKNGVGIAAPQIGVNLRVVIFGFQQNKRYPNEDPIPFTVLINPTIEPLSEETVEDWEGCLSLPGLRGLVTRYKKIKYSGYDADGNFFSRKVKDFHARVVQHEFDHINGNLYPQRMKDMKNFGYEDLLVERIVKWREDNSA
ncbi:MAG: peptide deformylase [Gammaproteobacteria bacterium]